jgi:hypothetical protein
MDEYGAIIKRLEARRMALYIDRRTGLGEL